MQKSPCGGPTQTFLSTRGCEASIICLFLQTFNYPRARSSASMPTYLPSHPYDCSAKRTLAQQGHCHSSDGSASGSTHLSNLAHGRCSGGMVIILLKVLCKLSASYVCYRSDKTNLQFSICARSVISIFNKVSEDISVHRVQQFKLKARSVFYKPHCAPRAKRICSKKLFSLKLP